MEDKIDVEVEIYLLKIFHIFLDYFYEARLF